MSAPADLPARILGLADELHAFAHQLAHLDPALGSRALLLAVRVSLLQPAVLDMQHQLRAALAAAPPAPCPTATAIAAINQRHASARIIADILGPVLHQQGGTAP